MSNLEPGCLAVIVESLDGISVGKIVQCIKVVGEHSLYGTVWHVRGRDMLVTEYGGTGNEADVPAKWLKKIEPGSELLHQSIVTKKEDRITDKI